MKSMLVLGLFRTDLSGLHWKRCVCVCVCLDMRRPFQLDLPVISQMR